MSSSSGSHEVWLWYLGRDLGKPEAGRKYNKYRDKRKLIHSIEKLCHREFDIIKAFSGEFELLTVLLDIKLY